MPIVLIKHPLKIITFSSEINRVTELTIINGSSGYALYLESATNCIVKDINNNILTPPCDIFQIKVYPYNNDWEIVCYNVGGNVN